MTTIPVMRRDHYDADNDGMVDESGASPLSDDNPQALGTANAGTGATSARSDHIHAMPNRARGPYDAIVYIQDGDVIAEDATGAEISSGASSSAASTVINAALQSSSAVNVLLGRGTFYLTAPLLLNAPYKVLRGIGKSVSILYVKTGSNCNAINITGSNLQRCEVKDLCIDGNKNNNSTGDGISIDTAGTDTHHGLANLDIKNMKGSGLVVAQLTRIVDISLSTFRYCTAHGMYVDGSDHNIFECDANNNGLHGFGIIAANSYLTACKAFSNGQSDASYSGFYISDVDIHLLNAQAQNNKGHGISFVNSINCILTGSLCESNNTSEGSYAGLNLSNADKSTIAGNSFCNQNLIKQQYGVVVDEATTLSLIHSNTFYGNITLPISISATALAANSVKFNTGYATEASGPSTGTGSEQTIAHGLVSTPSKVAIVPTETGATVSAVWADTTNIYCTVTTGKAFNWSAEV